MKRYKINKTVGQDPTVLYELMQKIEINVGQEKNYLTHFEFREPLVRDGLPTNEKDPASQTEWLKNLIVGVKYYLENESTADPHFLWEEVSMLEMPLIQEAVVDLFSRHESMKDLGQPRIILNDLKMPIAVEIPLPPDLIKITNKTVNPPQIQSVIKIVAHYPRNKDLAYYSQSNDMYRDSAYLFWGCIDEAYTETSSLSGRVLRNCVNFDNLPLLVSIAISGGAGLLIKAAESFRPESTEESDKSLQNFSVVSQ